MLGSDLVDGSFSSRSLAARRAARRPSPQGRAVGYAAGVGVVAVCGALSLVGARVLQIADLVMIFPLGVLAVSVKFGIGPAVFTGAVAVLAFDFLIVPPVFTFGFPDTRSALTLATMVLVTTVSCILSEQLRKQVERAKNQAEVERLRNALLSALSHDLRTPLTALIGASNALFEDRLEPRERREFARMVSEEATRLSHLVSNLLELTRLESGNVTAKRSVQAIDEVIGSALVRLEHKLEDRPVRTMVPEAIPLFGFDPVLVEQVIINLVENALKYTPPRSPIDIAVQFDQGQVAVEIADRGPGVPEGDEEKVFEKLYRGEAGARGDGGVGLGLTICRAIVTAHQGDIVFENRPGGGAIVRFTLPAREVKQPGHKKLQPAPSEERA